MVTYNEYLKNILTKIVNSYDNLESIQDNPGDLDHIKREMLKLNGFIKVLVHNTDEYKIPLSDFKTLKPKLRYYLENYFFEQEIDTMSSLYANDTHRMKNMRLKILQALKDRKMIDDVGELIEKL